MVVILSSSITIISEWTRGTSFNRMNFCDGRKRTVTIRVVLDAIRFLGLVAILDWLTSWHTFQVTLCTINCYSIVFDIVPHDFFEKNIYTWRWIMKCYLDVFFEISSLRWKCIINVNSADTKCDSGSSIAPKKKHFEVIRGALAQCF